jgi:phosphoribosylanthranilate isomerase
MFLKVCGITRVDDARHAIAEGATAIGLVFWRRSPRSITREQAARIAAHVPPTVRVVGVFVNEPIAAIRDTIASCGLTAVQFHGDEPPEAAAAIDVPILRSATVDDVESVRQQWPPGTLLLLDAADRVRRGGTGRRIDWTRGAAAARSGRIVLAGGLTPDNVEEAITVVRPFGVDVSSGVEQAPGVKDADKVTRFLASAQRAFAGLHAAGAEAR